MEGQENGHEIVERVSGLNPDQVLKYQAAAKTGDPSAIAFLIARGGYRALRREGATHEQAKQELGDLLNRTTVEVKQ